MVFNLEFLAESGLAGKVCTNERTGRYEEM